MVVTTASAGAAIAACRSRPRPGRWTGARNRPTTTRLPREDRTRGRRRSRSAGRISSSLSSRSPSGAIRVGTSSRSVSRSVSLRRAIEVVAMEQPPQQRHVGPGGKPATGQAPCGCIGRPITRLARIANRISHLKPTGERLRWGRKSLGEASTVFRHAMKLYGPDEAHRHSRVLRAVKKAMPEPETELEYENAYQLLVAVVLSAQATDVGVNKATGPLFGRQDAGTDTRRWAKRADRHIKTIGLFNTKAKNVIALVEDPGRASMAARSRATATRCRHCPASAARPPTW